MFRWTDWVYKFWYQITEKDNNSKPYIGYLYRIWCEFKYDENLLRMCCFWYSNAELVEECDEN